MKNPAIWDMTFEPEVCKFETQKARSVVNTI